MSDMTRRLLITAVSLTLTVAVITTYLFFYKKTRTITDQVHQQSQIQQSQIEDYAVTRYNDSLIYGSQVVSFLKNNETRFEEVYMDSGNGNNLITGLQSFHDFDSPAYINMNAIYLLEMEPNANGVLTKLQITLSNTP